MTNTPNDDDTEEPAEDAAQAPSGLGLSPSQVIAGGGAAAVASVIGGHLGLAGTVVGAFILSVISAVALPLFRASLEKSHAQIKRVVPRRVSAAPRTTSPRSAADAARVVRPTSGKVSAAPLPLERPRAGVADARRAPRKSPTRRKAWMAVGATSMIFLIGMGAILGFQAATGFALSKGTSALQSGVSQVVSNSNDGKGTPASNDGKGTPAKDTKPSAPAVESSTVPTGPATPTERPTPAPTPTRNATPTQEPTAPANVNTPVPASTPHPAVTSAGAVPAK